MGGPDPISALRRRGAAYLAFAKTEPGLYKAMFGDAGFLSQPTAGGPRKRLSTNLSAPRSRVLRHFYAPETKAKMLAMQIWAMTHGVAELMLAGQFRDQQVEAAALLESGVAALIETAVREALGVKGVMPPKSDHGNFSLIAL